MYRRFFYHFLLNTLFLILYTYGVAVGCVLSGTVWVCCPAIGKIMTASAPRMSMISAIIKTFASLKRSGRFSMKLAVGLMIVFLAIILRCGGS